MKKTRWGILGTAKIAREAVIPAMFKSPYCERLDVVAVASRDFAKAQAVCDAHGIKKAYGSYDELLADANIDAVYVPLPNHLHVPFSIRALEAGKHVLCEKPIALSAEQAEELANVAAKRPQLKIMEAFMYRHHPQWHWAKQVVRGGQIGEVRAIDSCFYFYDDDPAGILHHPEWGGGCLMDIGCYPVSLSRFLFDSEPARVLARFENNPGAGVDRSIAGVLEFDKGTATFSCSTQLALFQRVSVFGTRGRIELKLPFNPPTDRPSRAVLEVDGSVERIEFDICDQYGIQADLFSRAILENTDVPTPISDALANMHIIDALVRSGRNGKWEQLVPA
jgi:predicted dehydrogenase